MTRVAIHQPNYAPWAGYFHKLAVCDVFLFLDDAQFPKNSYVNRVKLRGSGVASWLTVPARPKLGTPIQNVVPSQLDWPERHLARMHHDYGKAKFFREVWEEIVVLYRALPTDNLAVANKMIIAYIADRLRLRAKRTCASDHPNPEGRRADDRLIDLVLAVGGDRYYSGNGGFNYQSENKFTAAGITLEVTRFVQLPYNQGRPDFEAGLSILDCLFHTGWDATAAYLQSTTPSDVAT